MAILAITLFSFNILKIISNIKIGRKVNRSDQPRKRLYTMLRVAFGQSKMNVRLVPAALHLVVYVGFIVVNIEVLEIILDGVLGNHRIFGGLGLVYNFLIATFELFALLVWIACLVFLIRRNFLKISRFSGQELKGWPRRDANAILISEILLMSAFLIMDAADLKLQNAGVPHYSLAGNFPVSGYLTSLLPDGINSLITLERACWWFHITGILIFLNYLPYSKHLHIFLAFPNTYYSKLGPIGAMDNMDSITNEVRSALIPTYLPIEMEPSSFGAKDVSELSWVNLLNAYSCTECGRCTDSCPANITGRKLSPRKIMMDTRDRVTEVGKNFGIYGSGHQDGKSLLDDYVTREEIWACTSCNACVEACPVNIDPLAIIMSMRRYIVMEESLAPTALNSVMANIENNQAPWKFSPADRMKWADE